MNLKSITFPGLEEEYSIQLTAEDVGARPDTWMPTVAEVGAAPGGFGYGEGLVNIGNANDDATFVVALAEQFNSISNKTKQIMFNYGGSAFVGTLWNAGNNYGTLVANSYVEPNVAYRFKQLVRICNNGTWGAWVDNSPTAFAPSGYGIGKLVNYEVTSDTEVDNVLISTIVSMEGHSFKRIVLSFKSTTNFANGGGHYYTDIYKLSTNYAMITIKSYISDGKTMQRVWYEGALKPWEWVNPPMTLGVEYRTTERWEGKPVYTTAVNVGTTVSGDLSLNTEFACTRIIRFCGYVGGYSLPFIQGSLTGEYSTWMRAYNNSGKVGIRITANNGTANLQAVVQVWYIK